MPSIYIASAAGLVPTLKGAGPFTVFAPTNDAFAKLPAGTVEGEKITVTSSGGMIMLTDAKGGMSHVTTADVAQSNGVIHVIDTVAMPAGGKSASMGTGKRSMNRDIAETLAMEKNGR